MVPRHPGSQLIAEALCAYLARCVTVAEVGFLLEPAKASCNGGGLDFPRDKRAALREAADYWSSVDRRNFLASPPFAVGAYSPPLYCTG